LLTLLISFTLPTASLICSAPVLIPLILSEISRVAANEA
jgi:hypothetical protein